MNRTITPLPAARALAAALLALCGAGRLCAAPPVPPVRFQDYRLANGLRVLLARDASAPVVSVCITYNVGSFVEPKGRTGFAHLFEHMLFQGSKNVPKGAFDSVIVHNGGDNNGSTSQDITNYTSIMPANQLEPVLFMEADRMAALDVSQENLDNQRAVVQEERRRNYDNQPYGRLWETLQANAYTNFAYRHSTIGSLKDLDAATLEDVRRFYKTYYAPNNAVLAIVGDLDPAETRRLVARYFGPIPRGPQPAFPSLAEPPQTRERRATLPDPLAPLPAYLSGYRIPNGRHPDVPALQALATILTDGKSSRLYRALVEVKQAATGVSAFADATRGPGLFYLSMDFAPGQVPRVAEAALEAELNRVRARGVTAAEMQKARIQARRAAVAGRRSSWDRAERLGEFAVLFQDPNRINTALDRFNAVTAADVRRVARLYLTPKNRTVVLATPAPRRAAAPGGRAR